jgi:hypothetical protein
VVNEVNGTWHKAITLPVTGSPGDVEVSALACASPGNCSAAGISSAVGTIAGLDGTFVLNEVNGTWRKPIANTRQAHLHLWRMGPIRCVP